MKPEHIILHHSASPITQKAETINEYHRKKWNFKSSLGGYAGYHYIIEDDGCTTQWRADNEPGAHTIGRNYDSIGICVVGWFDDGHNSFPTPQQQDALRELIEKKRKEYGIGLNDVKFHRDYTEKSCPGYHITKDWLYNLLGNNMKKDNREFYKYKRKAKGWSSLEDWIEAAREYREEREELDNQLEKIKDELDKVQEKIVHINRELTVEASKHGALKTKYQNLIKEKEELKLEASDCKTMLKSKNQEISEKVKDNKVAMEKLEETKDKVKDLKFRLKVVVEKDQKQYSLWYIVILFFEKIRSKLQNITIK